MCGAEAYVGFTNVECSNPECRHYKPVELDLNLYKENFGVEQRYANAKFHDEYYGHLDLATGKIITCS